MQILALSGSLRLHSSNAAVLLAAASRRPPHTHWSLYQGLGQLPHFNPDVDADPPEPHVLALRSAVAAARAVVISSPEYAFGVPGSLKNALDWLVSSGELYQKPVALINATPGSGGGLHAQAALELTLGALGARLRTETTLSISCVRQKLDREGNVLDADTDSALRAVLSHLVADLT